ncbi:glutamate-cysteine ligase family protein [Nocardioides bizhenqiangii]|uniref:glutamate--cysteine ligase n=1 Tax=Nocardioides bizhenqiangii TaxID=3095076 RepID=A0ABZ0ZLQ8_9ACTN|nr:glutamate-cysteine ligase family protein [Nocardioides sp. HM61]WQQ25239.1 glutamate-cysteine ligase family protein [Nocardioides sp. HM61]
MTTTGMRSQKLAFEEAVEAQFDGAYDGSRRVGLERELIAYRHSPDITEPVPVADLRQALAGVPDVGFEPGGQVELHPGPSETAAAAVAVLRERERAARAALAAVGIHLAAVGLDPWRSPERLGLQLTDHRYRAMDRHFDKIGPAGRRFMRQTAGLQVCVDLRPGVEGVVQWRAANLISPVLAALFANSRVCGGRRLNTDGGRTAVCLATDPARMAYGRLGRSPGLVGEYLRFATTAPPLSERLADVDAHLTTLFPAVRPRGRYLEVRALDSVPGSDLGPAVALTTALLAVPGAADEIVSALDGIDVPGLWALAAGPGIRHPILNGLAAGLVRIAQAAAADLPSGYLPPDQDGLARVAERAGLRSARP